MAENKWVITALTTTIGGPPCRKKGGPNFLLRQLLQKGAIEHLPLPGLQSIHHAGNGTLHVVFGPQYQLLVHKVLTTCEEHKGFHSKVFEIYWYC